MPADLPAPYPTPATPARLAPAPTAPGYATAPSGRRIMALSGRQKAAILVRLLLVEGADLSLATLPEAMQAELTEQMAQMRLIDRDTLDAVVSEFIETLEQVGLSFPDGIDGALKALSGKLSPGAAGRLRQLARARGHADPWDRIAATETDPLLELLAPESPEVVAVVLSKLPVSRAAEMLGRMPGERARRVALAVARTEGIAPETVIRIGAALAAELDRKPPSAFVARPAARVGAILNSVDQGLRDALLAGLEAEDEDFAQGVRKAIFTFAHIADRLTPLDVPKALRGLDQTVLVTALCHALPLTGTAQAVSAEFLLANMSQRIAANLRDEIEQRGRVKPRDGEAAGAAVVAHLRSLADAGEITLAVPDDAA